MAALLSATYITGRMNLLSATYTELAVCALHKLRLYRISCPSAPNRGVWQLLAVSFTDEKAVDTFAAVIAAGDATSAVSELTDL
jgi:hypothetical protein